MEDLIIDYAQGNLTGELKEHVEKVIAKNDKWKEELDRLNGILEIMDNSPELQPDQSLRADFDLMLSGEIENQKVRQIPLITGSAGSWAFKIAASIALVLVGAVIGIMITKNQQNERELLALKSEVELTKQLVISSLQNQSSASSRLQGVNTSMTLSNSDDEIITALINTLNHDDNTNVRLAALDALARFSDIMQVKKALVEALETQDDPVVTISLINLMVRLKENDAVEPLRRLLEKGETDEAVKSEAHIGILKLS